MVDFAAALTAAIENPAVYFLLVFVFAILVAVILPIPIETALLLPIQQGSLTLFTVALFAVASGKAVGAWLVFLLGLKVEGPMRRWAQAPDPPENRALHRHAWYLIRHAIARSIRVLERFVRWSGSLGLFVILSIPFMSDTLPIYFYALFNEEGKALDRRHFVLSNFLAGFNRVAILFVLALTLWRGLLQIP